jgi:single-strand DNA-binding protein
MMSAVATISGNVTADPQLRFIPSGDAVANFTVAHTKRKFDKNTNTWSDDGEPLYLNVTAWKALGEGAAETLKRGDPVTVTGELQQRSWEKDGQKHTRIELIAKEIGLSVRPRSSGRKEVSQPAQEIAW